ncbi:Cof-type HAD-IIB family hydrolase [Microaceticoccus formicicus]|uniref:Cof-type HAD-IIB family hydrolase n=1 Tax=Microaceticoccus formicicus TaxID=3118105 RepID=UPI003CD030F9|nr:Cof-type HAD-IIB family hydrolase [Peptoniphilaceae bacterium AMB_02]
MKIKAFATDLDGTLLYKNEISQSNLKAIESLKESGVIPIFVTGRIYTSALYYAKKHGLNIPIIGCNGAVVANVEGEIISYNPIEDEVSMKIAELCNKNNLYYHFYDLNTFYSRVMRANRIKHLTKSMDEDILFQVDMMFSDNAIYRAIERGEGIAKFVINVSEEKVEELFSSLDLSKIEITKSGPHSIEIMKSGITKYKGLEILADYYDLNINQIAAIGDYDNDIPMIENAGYGIAMDNALESVKEHADYITLSNVDDGVSAAIKHLYEEGLI